MIENGIIKKPVSVSDPYRAMGLSPRGMWDTGYACYDSGRGTDSGTVNKWSLHKPLKGTSPQDINTSEAAWLAYCKACDFGMLLPRNDTANLGFTARWLKPLALRVTATPDTSHTVKNYLYQPPVKGVDFARLTDFEGYRHGAPAPWTSGIAGSEGTEYAGHVSSGTKLDVDTFDTSTIAFYMGMPSDADITLAMLFPGDWNYRFMVEFYKNDQSMSSDADVPELVVATMAKVADMDYGARIEVPVSLIRSKLGLTGDDTTATLYAVVGVNRFGNVPSDFKEHTAGCGWGVLDPATHYGQVAGGYGMLSPWTDWEKPWYCRITLASYSKLTMKVDGIATLTSTSYSPLPAERTTWASDGFRLKVSVTNRGDEAVTLKNAGVYDQANKVNAILRMQAQGSYDTGAASYPAMCVDSGTTVWREVRVSGDTSFSSNAPVSVPAKSTKTVYLQCSGLLPKGDTDGCTITLSTDEGASWVITHHFSAPLTVK